MGYIVQQQGGRRASRYASRRNADINMTNLMDVMMVLLVVFMVAAPLMTSGIALDLPKVGGKALSGDDTSVPAEEIVGKLQAIRGQNAELTVTISGDTGAEYGRVIGLMALLKEAGFDKVGLKTEPQPYSGKKKK